MPRILFAGLVAAALATLSASSAAFADGAEPALVPGLNADSYVTYYSAVEITGSPVGEGVVSNLGGAISGGFYGNTSNSGTDIDAPDNGHGVTAPASPGPLVGGCSSVPGSSLGQFITDNGPEAVPASDDAGPGC